ncbi:MAG: formylglycine-generating enzyme family protein [Methanosarcinales archaeon]|nr:formylglycine-generating enzyme family protein [Methanosarcinales archaeon]
MSELSQTPTPSYNQKTLTNSIGMEFVLIPYGEFEMGTLPHKDWDPNQGPIHNVIIPYAFYINKYEVSQEQWREIMGNNPSYFMGDDLPVEQVSWNDVQEFIRKLNEKEGTNKYRLPSEAEWEYAARAGTTTLFSFSDEKSELSAHAWYAGNSGRKTHPVGTKDPNPWGLYDIHGNVWEWVQDGWHYDYTNAPADGSVWTGGVENQHVYRGGSWEFEAYVCMSAVRWSGREADSTSNSIGFRLLMEV